MTNIFCRKSSRFAHILLILLSFCLLCKEVYGQATLNSNPSGSSFELAPQGNVPSDQVVDPNEIVALQQAAKEAPDEPALVQRGIDALDLMRKGGWVMIPLAIVSLCVLMWSLERLFSLRRSRILPLAFVQPLTQMIRESDLLPAEDAYRLCIRHPSVAANVVATTLIRTGRPLMEIEKTASEAIQREVDTATGPIRWLAFLAGIAPLLGLLGTVSGLIQAFYATTQLDPTQNRAEALATGIYEALVTTLVGLMIAIPAAAVAQYFENRVIRQFRRVEELIALLLPRLEGYENRIRFDPIGSELVARDLQLQPPVREKDVRSIRGTVITPASVEPEALDDRSDSATSSVTRRASSAVRTDRSSRKPLP